MRDNPGVRWRLGYFSVASAITFVAAYNILGRELMMQLLNSLVISLCVAVVGTFSVGVYETLRHRRPINGEDVMMIGIILGWSAEATQRIWSLMWNGSGRPEWMVENWFIPSMLWVTAIGLIFHVAAPGTIAGRIPKKSWIAIGCTLGFAAALTLMIIQVTR